MVMIATFGVSGAGVPAIHELCLMPSIRQWLPVEDGYEKQLIERLVADGRSFVKGLRYNLDSKSALPSATLTDCGDAAPLQFIVRPGDNDAAQCGELRDASEPPWLWNPALGPMPPPPPRPTSRHQCRKDDVECD